MDKFIIDRQFGQAIWVDVEKGIVQKCYNEAKWFNKRMNELYKGKSISYLKEDFESRMKPTYHNVRPESILLSLQNIHVFKSRIKQNWTIISGLGIMYHGKNAKELQEQQKARELKLKEEIAEYEHELTLASKEYEIEKKRLVEEHNYVTNL